MINEIIENTASTKMINSKMSIGKPWITCLKNEYGVKRYDRHEINKIATNFYKNLYHDSEDNLLNIELDINKKAEELPEIIKDEVEYVIRKMKKGKAAGPDGVKNEYIKYGGNEVTILGRLVQLGHKR